MQRLLELTARNFKSLAEVRVPLGRLNVLVGPNESGKSNFLDVVQFLGDSAREDLRGAIGRRGDYERLRYRGIRGPDGPIHIGVKAIVTEHASPTAPDEYDLTFWERPLTTPTVTVERRVLIRRESFLFKRVGGRGRRIKISGQRVSFSPSRQSGEQGPPNRELTLKGDSLGLATLPKIDASAGGKEVEKFARLFLGFRVFDIDVGSARVPAEVTNDTVLATDASNLSAFLLGLRNRDGEAYGAWLRDARTIVPGLEDVVFRSVGGPTAAVVIELKEAGLEDRCRLGEASFGTIRALALLAVLHDPNPGPMTAIEEIDHGLHPYAFDHLTVVLRAASERTQLLLATHAPAFVNRLQADELIVCERDLESGATRLPAIAAATVRELEEAGGGRLGLGELWFSGSLGGVPH